MHIGGNRAFDVASGVCDVSRRLPLFNDSPTLDTTLQTCLKPSIDFDALSPATTGQHSVIAATPDRNDTTLSSVTTGQQPVIADTPDRKVPMRMFDSPAANTRSRVATTMTSERVPRLKLRPPTPSKPMYPGLQTLSAVKRDIDLNDVVASPGSSPTRHDRVLRRSRHSAVVNRTKLEFAEAGRKQSDAYRSASHGAGRESAISESSSEPMLHSALQPHRLTTSTAAAVITRPQTSAATAVITRPQTSAAAAVITRPQTSTTAAVITRLQTSAAAAVITRPQTHAQSDASCSSSAVAVTCRPDTPLPQTATATASISRPHNSGSHHQHCTDVSTPSADAASRVTGTKRHARFGSKRVLRVKVKSPLSAVAGGKKSRKLRSPTSCQSRKLRSPSSCQPRKLRSPTSCQSLFVNQLSVAPTPQVAPEAMLGTPTRTSPLFNTYIKASLNVQVKNTQETVSQVLLCMNAFRENAYPNVCNNSHAYTCRCSYVA